MHLPLLIPAVPIILKLPRHTLILLTKALLFCALLCIYFCLRGCFPKSMSRSLFYSIRVSSVYISVLHAQVQAYGETPPCYHVGRAGESNQSASNLDRDDGIQGDHTGAGRRDGITCRSYGAKDATYEPRCSLVHPSTRDTQQCDLKCQSVAMRLNGHLHPALSLRQEQGRERAVWYFDAATASLVRSPKALMHKHATG
jgi:hypothetical protein